MWHIWHAWVVHTRTCLLSITAASVHWRSACLPVHTAPSMSIHPTVFLYSYNSLPYSMSTAQLLKECLVFGASDHGIRRWPTKPATPLLCSIFKMPPLMPAFFWYSFQGHTTHLLEARDQFNCSKFVVSACCERALLVGRATSDCQCSMWAPAANTHCLKCTFTVPS